MVKYITKGLLLLILSTFSITCKARKEESLGSEKSLMKFHHSKPWNGIQIGIN